MNKKRVGIIFGGKSAEHEVSLQSAKNIVEAIDTEKYTVSLFGMDKEGCLRLYDPSSYLENADDPKHIALKQSEEVVAIVPGSTEQSFIHAKTAKELSKIDVVFPIIHGTLGEDGSLQGMLRLLDLPFVGPNVLSSSICMDKDIAKKLLTMAGIKVAKGYVYTKEKQKEINYQEVMEKLGSPIFVKPANQGSSVGISKVSTMKDFEKAVETAFQYDHKIVIEEAIVGREIECSVLGNEEPMVSIPGEILPKTDFYSYESKYIDEKGAELAIPAHLTKDMVKNVQQTAIQAYEALQCEGLARVDFFVTNENEIYVNEINTLPGFTEISMYPKLWEASGILYTDLITKLIELALDRHEKNKALKGSVWE